MPVKRSNKVHKFHEGTGDDNMPVVSMFVVKDGDEPFTRIDVELFVNKVPKACDLFLQTCAFPTVGDKRNAKRGSYKGCRFVRLTKEALQVADGSGPRAVPLSELEAEIGRVNHGVGIASLCRSSTSFDESFFFCLTDNRLELDSLDKRHVAFGRVTGGLDALMGLRDALVPYVQEGCVIVGSPYAVSEVVPKAKQ
ncbi:cyclophilin, putative [Trypanosoma equiperdum]|uniref:Cyclophilin, putative n=3 Tax=Trypanozoon TaxID=39700 RepID=Q57TS2_TRYB2|nr:cyclophilin, putative [Trypanosoma brucei brucei TREU927]AAX80052.1 cyclophilin, putative [Trypanosoma brucei]AAZ13455.1 cyclophilin, putative [Trypanosoma brucei brucei TREU927]RHW73009.1 cyclophilin [Trypanosoma brucei equiperdum]SCU67726.1 cyclophilin, putative [Trypanosoma equiperdum]